MLYDQRWTNRNLQSSEGNDGRDLLSEDVGERNGGSGEGMNEDRFVEPLQEMEDDQVTDRAILISSSPCLGGPEWTYY